MTAPSFSPRAGWSSGLTLASTEDHLSGCHRSSALRSSRFRMAAASSPGVLRTPDDPSPAGSLAGGKGMSTIRMAARPSGTNLALNSNETNAASNSGHVAKRWPLAAAAAAEGAARGGGGGGALRLGGGVEEVRGGGFGGGVPWDEPGGARADDDDALLRPCAPPDRLPPPPLAWPRLERPLSAREDDERPESGGDERGGGDDERGVGVGERRGGGMGARAAPRGARPAAAAAALPLPKRAANPRSCSSHLDSQSRPVRGSRVGDNARARAAAGDQLAHVRPWHALQGRMVRGGG